MNLRNPKFNSYGTIDCEIEHPVYGWIPFTASPDDVEEHGRAIHKIALEAGPAEYVAPPPPPPVVPSEISFAQLLIGLVTERWITEEEGDAWADGKLPAPVTALIGTLPQEARFAARTKAKRPQVISRDDYLVGKMGLSIGKTPEDLDAFFIKYSGT